jgi:hypothetical protein
MNPMASRLSAFTASRNPVSHSRAAAFCSLAITCLVVTTAFGQLPATQLSSVFPPGGKVDTTFDVTIAGADTDNVHQLVFSHPGITAASKMTPATEFEPAKPVERQFTVTIAADVPQGSYEARVVGRFGASNPRTFVVGVLDEVTNTATNAMATAPVAAINQTINGLVDNNQRDFFKVTLKKGQRILIDCQARRIDSRLNATMALTAPNGNEIARSLDYLGHDPLIDVTAPVDGDYTLSLYDLVYRGGADYFYRLTIHDKPFIDFVFPPSGLAGSTSEFTLYGRNLPGGEPSDVHVNGIALQKKTVQVTLPKDDAARQFEIAGRAEPRKATLNAFQYRAENGQQLPIYFAQQVVVVEQGPNDTAETAQTVTAPCEFVGQFYPQRDTDWVQFEGKKGDVYYIEFFSHRLGTNVDARLVVQRVTKNDKGEETVSNVANVDDPSDRNGKFGSDFDISTDDPSYRLTCSNDAMYRIMLRDQFGGSRVDPRAIYRLVIRPAQPDFRLIVVSQPVTTPVNANLVRVGGITIRQGGTTAVKVTVQRQDGFDSEIEITAEGLPAGVSTRGVLLGATQTTATLIFEASEDAADAMANFRVLGKAKLGEAEVTRVARSGSVVWGTSNRLQNPPNFRLAHDLTMAVIGQEVAPAYAEAGENKVWETSRGGKLEIPVTVKRRRNFKGDLTLAAKGLPGELKVANVVIKGDKTEGKLIFNVTNKSAKPGVYTFFLRADTKSKLIRDESAVAAAEAEQKNLDGKVKEVDATSKSLVQRKDSAVTTAKTATTAIKPAEEIARKAITEAQQAAENANKAAEALKSAQEVAAKDEANQDLTKAVEEAQKAMTSAEEVAAKATAAQAAAETKLSEVQVAAAAAEAAKVEAEKQAAAGAEKLKQVTALKAAADKRLAAVKKANAPKDLAFVAISTPVRVRIVDSPLQLTATAPAEPVQQGGTVEVPVSIKRLYGFADKVDLTLEVPKGVTGLGIKNFSLEKDKLDGKFEVTANDKATPGEHTVTIKAKAKFNAIAVETTVQLVLKVTPKEEPAKEEPAKEE